MARPTPEEFLKDPKYTEERDFLRGVWAGFSAEEKAKAEEEAKNKPPKKGFLDELFGG